MGCVSVCCVSRVRPAGLLRGWGCRWHALTWRPAPHPSPAPPRRGQVRRAEGGVPPPLGADPPWDPSSLAGFCGVSGAYNLQALAGHLHRRGLYHSLYNSIHSVGGRPVLRALSPTHAARWEHEGGWGWVGGGCRARGCTRGLLLAWATLRPPPSSPPPSPLPSLPPSLHPSSPPPLPS